MTGHTRTTNPKQIRPCSIPGRPSLAQIGDVCERCRIAFDWVLQRPNRNLEPEPFPQHPSEPGPGADDRDTLNGPKRSGQCCPIWERRRTCRRIRGRWECWSCAEIDGYVGIFAWGGLWLRDPGVRTIMPIRH